MQRGMVGEEYNRVIEPDIKALRATLEDLGIAENTLIIAMADNGPMTHHPPPGAGLGEGVFRGGKGDFIARRGSRPTQETAVRKMHSVAHADAGFGSKLARISTLGSDRPTQPRK